MFFTAHWNRQCAQLRSVAIELFCSQQIKDNILQFIMSKKRTYLESCIDFGSEFIIKHDVQQPQCIFCFKVLGNVSVKPLIFKPHFTSYHSTHVLDDHTSLLAKRTQFRAAGPLPSLGFVCKEKSAMEISCGIALRIAKENKCHTIGERLVKPCLRTWHNLFAEENKRRN